MRDLLAGTSGAVAAVVGVVLNVVVASSVVGVVRENCLDIEASAATQTVQVDEHWTYVLFPPLVFAGIDPSGRCVRNLPARQAADALGLWDLPSPEEQVRRHVEDQLRPR